MTVPGIQNGPYFMGNLGHSQKFHPPFSQQIGKIGSFQTPLFFYDYEGAVLLHPYFRQAFFWGGIKDMFFPRRKNPYFIISWATDLEIRSF